jgi:molecular chaperone IbpA
LDCSGKQRPPPCNAEFHFYIAARHAVACLPGALEGPDCGGVGDWFGASRTLLLKEDVAMRDEAMKNLELAPLLRSSVGFDRVLEFLERASRSAEDAYPPYNIERTADNTYRITLALAGLVPSEITVMAEHNVLRIEGGKAAKDDGQYLYHGILTRPFRRTFSLADYVQVKGASFEEGLLHIELAREVPEAMKPRRISIDDGAAAPRPVKQET